MNLGLNSESDTSRQFLLLAPPKASLGQTSLRAENDPGRRQQLLADMQRLRGRIYLQDNAITREDLTDDGRHVQEIDEESWHLLIVNTNGRLVGCTRYLQHTPSTRFRRLR